MRARNLGTSAAALLCAAILAGCGSPPRTADLPARKTVPLGGTALVQHKHDLERARSSLVAFRRTLASVHRKKDADTRAAFHDFLNAYMGLHLDPLLRNEWQSQHPELMAVDAGLRLLKADLLIRARQRSEADAVLDDVEHRFREAEELLVEYPPGEQTPLRQALQLLRGKKWWTLTRSTRCDPAGERVQVASAEVS